MRRTGLAFVKLVSLERLAVRSTSLLSLSEHWLISFNRQMPACLDSSVRLVLLARLAVQFATLELPALVDVSFPPPQSSLLLVSPLGFVTRTRLTIEPSVCNCINGICASPSASASCACSAGWSKATNGTQCAVCATGYFATAQGDCLGKSLCSS